MEYDIRRFQSYNLFFCRDPNNNVMEEQRPTPKLNLVNRHSSLAADTSKQDTLGHVDFSRLPPHAPLGVKMENHDLPMLSTHPHQDAMIAQNLSEFNNCLADTHMLNTLTTSLVGL